MLTPDQIGRLGALIVEIGFSRPVLGKYKRGLFRPTFLGDKYPSVDYVIDVITPTGETVGFFFVQVRATMQEQASETRLGIKVDADKYERLVALPIPTYLIGVDLTQEAGYIIAASRPRNGGVSSITTKFDLTDDGVRERLYEEVCGFWSQYKKSNFQSEFHDG